LSAHHLCKRMAAGGWEFSKLPSQLLVVLFQTRRVMIYGKAG